MKKHPVKKLNILSGVIALSILFSACAQGSDIGGSDDIEALQAQIDGLQAELDAIKAAGSAASDEDTAPTGDSTAQKGIENKGEEYMQINPTNPDGSFREIHGALKVEKGKLLDQNGDHVRLYGMSTHGIGRYPQFVTEETFRTLRDNWGCNCVRLALYTAEEDGFCTGGDVSMQKNYILNGINHATNLGMYVIVDWHILSDNNPNIYKEQAKDFFDWVSSSYSGYTNIIYEICNEPNGGTSWDDIKTYADEIIPTIRNNDPDAIILVGTPSWSQEIDKPLYDPLPYDNVMYTLHFYAATHKDSLRRLLNNCAFKGGSAAL